MPRNPEIAVHAVPCTLYSYRVKVWAQVINWLYGKGLVSATPIGKSYIRLTKVPADVDSQINMYRIVIDLNENIVPSRRRHRTVLYTCRVVCNW